MPKPPERILKHKYKKWIKEIGDLSEERKLLYCLVSSGLKPDESQADTKEIALAQRELWEVECELTIDFIRNVKPANAFEGLVGFSIVFRSILEEIKAFAPLDAPVYIYGETGSGKEMLARALHRISRRSGEEKYIKYNCALCPDDDKQRSELFGHERGSFTGAIIERSGLIKKAEGGTLFLDEVGWLKPATQAQLNRFIEEGERQSLGADESEKTNVRIVSAFNKVIMVEDHLDWWNVELEYMQLTNQLEWYDLVVSKKSQNTDEEYYRALYEKQDKSIYDLCRLREKIKKEIEESGTFLNEDFAFRLRQLSIRIMGFAFRPLDAVSIVIYYCKQFGLNLRPYQWLAVAHYSIFGGVRSIKRVLNEVKARNDYIIPLAPSPFELKTFAGDWAQLDQALYSIEWYVDLLERSWKPDKRTSGALTNEEARRIIQKYADSNCNMTKAHIEASKDVKICNKTKKNVKTYKDRLVEALRIAENHII